MTTLNINRLLARYRLAPEMADEKARLDRALQRVTAYSLEAALARCDVPDSDEICIRELRVPLRLRLSESVEDLAAAWSLALAEAIRNAASGRSRGMVRYGSRHAAFWDMARLVLNQNYERAWAWRQLGFWNTGDSPSPSEARRELVVALTAEARCIVPVVRTLLSGGGVPVARAEEFFSNIEVREWRMLAKAALSEANVEPAWIEGSSQPGIAEIPQAVRRSIASWPLLRGTSLDRVMSIPEGRYAVAALLLLAESPETFLGDRAKARAALDGAATALFLPARLQPQQQDQPARMPQNESRHAAATNDDSLTVSEPPAVGGRGHESYRRQQAAPSEEQPEPSMKSPAPTELASEADVSPRARALTRYGGLLFLLSALETSGLLRKLTVGKFRRRPPLAKDTWLRISQLTKPHTGPTSRYHPGLLPARQSWKFLAPGAFTGRPLRWTLHQLAMQLAPVDERDAAALAFAGLGPSGVPPSHELAPPTEIEITNLSRCVNELRTFLTGILANPAVPGESVIDYVCRKDAEVLADPGWIDVCFPLDSISTFIRRAGLDLNPGYLPWLGVVVRFLYE